METKRCEIMNTPIYDFLTSLNQKGIARFFMPGHKGEAFWENHPLKEAFPYDITEIAGADALFEAEGIIDESEKNASYLFGSRDTLYSAGGSTLCIQAMLALVSVRGKKIIAGRNAHMAFIHSCILLDLEPVWILPKVCDPYGLCGMITPDQVEDLLKIHSDAAAVYLTSPDYLGNTADIKAIADLCAQKKIPLICDNAHGAYLKFTEPSAHPIDLGASMCCDSAHKTLPVLTGGAYLHLNKDFFASKDDAKKAMNLFGSTSPSYLILLSLDLCNRYLSERGKKDFLNLKIQMDHLKKLLNEKGIRTLSNQMDFAKLTIDANTFGYSGFQMAEYFEQKGFPCEYANQNYTVYMISPMNRKEEIRRFSDAALCLEPGKLSIKKEMPSYHIPNQVMSVRKAWQKSKSLISIDQAEGKIAGETLSSCPPGVPLIMPGEVFTKEVKNICKNSGIFFVKVVK